MGRAVILLINRAKAEVVEALPEIRAIIQRGGGRIAFELDTRLNEPPPPVDGAELIMVLGGDGTLITQAVRCLPLGLPMLGVNLGKLGFLAEYDLESLRAQARDLFGGAAPLAMLERAIMAVHVERGAAAPQGAEPAAGAGPALALNDAVITAGPPFRMISIGLSIDQQPGPVVRGDGLIVSTPLGSTAYNASAGGPIVAPDARVLTITPIAVQSLAFRPVVVAGESAITIHLGRVNHADAECADHSPDGGTALIIDGQLHGRLYQDDRVHVKLDRRTLHLVRNPRSNYWRTLLHKMKWAESPVAGG